MINIKNFSLGFSTFALFFSFFVMLLNTTHLKGKNLNTTQSSFNSKYIAEVIETNPEYKFKLFYNGYYYFEIEDGKSIEYVRK